MTKKSVKPPALRRSSTTTSTAFLSCTAFTAPSTLFGSLGAAFFRVATFLDALVFAMQAVYRSIQVVCLDMPCDGPGHQLVDRFSAREPLPDRRRRDIARARVNDENARRSVTCDRLARNGRHPRTQLGRPLRRLIDRHARPRNHD